MRVFCPYRATTASINSSIKASYLSPVIRLCLKFLKNLLKSRQIIQIQSQGRNHGKNLGATSHTIRKCKKMAGQNTFKILLLNDDNIIEEHQETRMKMPNMCPFEKMHFLTQIDLNPRLRNLDKFLKKYSNGTFKTLQMKVFGNKIF